MTTTPRRYAIAHDEPIIVPASEEIEKAMGDFLRDHIAEADAYLEPLGVKLSDLVQPSWMRIVYADEIREIEPLAPQQRTPTDPCPTCGTTDGSRLLAPHAMVDVARAAQGAEPEEWKPISREDAIKAVAEKGARYEVADAISEGTAAGIASGPPVHPLCGHRHALDEECPADV